MTQSRSDLVEKARAAARHAYAPYSGFGVGAAVMLADGSVITGTNFENASYGLTLCAETVAIATANAQGHLRDIRAIAIIGGKLGPDGTLEGSDPVRPCGRCRQIIHEAAVLSGGDLPIHCASADGVQVETHLASELLPFAFGPDDLGIA